MARTRKFSGKPFSFKVEYWGAEGKKQAESNKAYLKKRGYKVRITAQKRVRGRRHGSKRGHRAGTTHTVWSRRGK